MSCKYRDALGKVGEGAHSYRVGGIAVVDVLLTVIAAYVLHLGVYPEDSASWWKTQSFWLVLGGLFLLGIIMHRLFCVRTTIDRWLFQNRGTP